MIRYVAARAIPAIAAPMTGTATPAIIPRINPEPPAAALEAAPLARRLVTTGVATPAPACTVPASVFASPIPCHWYIQFPPWKSRKAPTARATRTSASAPDREKAAAVVAEAVAGVAGIGFAIGAGGVTGSGPKETEVIHGISGFGPGRLPSAQSPSGEGFAPFAQINCACSEGDKVSPGICPIPTYIHLDPIIFTAKKITPPMSSSSIKLPLDMLLMPLVRLVRALAGPVIDVPFAPVWVT